MARKLNFKSKKAYKKWVAYGNIHGDFEKVKGHSIVLIKGKRIYPKHRTKGKQIRADDMFRIG